MRLSHKRFFYIQLVFVTIIMSSHLLLGDSSLENNCTSNNLESSVINYVQENKDNITPLLNECSVKLENQNPLVRKYKSTLLMNSELKLPNDIFENDDFEINLPKKTFSIPKGKIFKQITALNFFIYLEDVEMVKVLIETGADIEKRMQLVSSTGGFSYVPPITLAVMLGNKSLAQLLIESGARLNVAQEQVIAPEIETPLIAAIIQKDIEMIELLIESGSDVNFISDSLRTSLEVAQESGNETILKILQLSGAKEIDLFSKIIKKIGSYFMSVKDTGF